MLFLSACRTQLYPVVLKWIFDTFLRVDIDLLPVHLVVFLSFHSKPPYQKYSLLHPLVMQLFPKPLGNMKNQLFLFCLHVLQSRSLGCRETGAWPRHFRQPLSYFIPLQCLFLCMDIWLCCWLCSFRVASGCNFILFAHNFIWISSRFLNLAYELYVWAFSGPSWTKIHFTFIVETST